MKFVESKGWKNFMSKLYGWGAAVVILGAMFKIMHFPGAGPMLVVGLSVEALIFFFSAFEPPHEEPDWSLVYPELAGIDTGDDEPSHSREIKGGSVAPAGVQNITLSSNLDHLLEEANIGPELIENLGAGLRNLSENVSKMADISNAAIATDSYIQNMEKASQSVLELSQSYANTNEYLKHDLSLSEEYANSLQSAVSSMNELGDTYKVTAQNVKENLSISQEYNDSIKNITSFTNELAANYSRSSELLVQTVEALENSANQGTQYSDQLQKTSQNLEALNAVYELQLQASDAQYQSVEKLKTTTESLASNFTESLSHVSSYKEQMEMLTLNISALNSVYGNMLSAMNFNPGNK